jgi:hypothetical protein
MPWRWGGLHEGCHGMSWNMPWGCHEMPWDAMGMHAMGYAMGTSWGCHGICHGDA